MTEGYVPAIRPDLFGQLAASDPYQGRARRLFERGQVVAASGNQADVRVGYDARGNALELKQVPVVSGYAPRVGDWVAVQYEAGHSGAPWVTGPSMAADDSADSAGIGVFAVSESAPAEPRQSTIYFDASLGNWRGWDGADWVDFSAKLHNNLPDLQGGAAGEYYHLTAAQAASLVALHPFDPGRVLITDAAGQVATDAGAGYSATNDRLSIGSGTLDRYGTFAGVAVGASDYTSLHLTSATDTGYAMVSFGRARGSLAAPARPAANDLLGVMRSFGYESTSPSLWSTSVEQRFYANQDWTNAAHGSRWEIWGVVNGSTSLTVWASACQGQWLLAGGSAAAPSLARMSYADDGLFWPADGAMGIALGGTEKWRFVAGALYPIVDNSEDIGSSTAGLRALFLSDASDSAPAANGETRMQSTRRSLAWRIGDTTKQAQGQRYVRTSTYTNQSSSAENTVDTDTVDADDWAAGKSWHLFITGTATSNSNGGRSSNIRVKLAGTTFATFEVASNSPGNPVNDTQWVIEGTLTCRSVSSSGSVAYGLTLHRRDVQGSPATITEITGTSAGANTVNTATAQDIVVTVQHNDASTSVTRVQQVVIWED